MDTTVLVAIIGMVAAILTAIASLITALLVTKKTEKADQNLERLRLDQEQVKLLLGIKNETFEESLKATEEACVLIQKTRDEIRECLPKIREGAKQKDLKPAQDSCENLVTFFQDKHYLLIPEHRAWLHEIKNLSNGIQLQLLNALRHKSSDRKKLVDSLQNYVAILGKVQSEFLEYRDKMITTLGTTSNPKAG